MNEKSAANKELVTRFIASVNERDYSAFDALLTDDFCIPPGGPGLTKDALKVVLGFYVSAFPDLNYAVEELIAEGEAVVARLRMSGTHSGDYQGRAGTGKTFAVDEVDIFTIRDGKIAGYRITWDEAGFARRWALRDRIGVGRTRRFLDKREAASKGRQRTAWGRVESHRPPSAQPV